MSSQYELHSRAAFDLRSLTVLYDLPALVFVALVRTLGPALCLCCTADLSSALRFTSARYVHTEPTASSYTQPGSFVPGLWSFGTGRQAPSQTMLCSSRLPCAQEDNGFGDRPYANPVVSLAASLFRGAQPSCVLRLAKDRHPADRFSFVGSRCALYSAQAALGLV